MRILLLLSNLVFCSAQLGGIFGPPALGAPPAGPAASTPIAAPVSPTTPPAVAPTTPISTPPTVVSSAVNPAASSAIPVATTSSLLGGLLNPTISSVTPGSTASPVVSSILGSVVSNIQSVSADIGELNATAVVVVVTRTILSTDANGSTVTSVAKSSSTSTATPSSVSNASSDGSTGKTWGIIGGVIGGIALLSALIFIVWRMSQKRFSDLDDEHDDIKWPELQPEGKVNAAASTLNPLGTRRTGRAGIEMDGEKDESEYGGDEDPSYGHQYQNAGYSAADNGGGQYYDPYLGGSSAPSPAPVNIYPPPPHQQNYPSYSQHSLPPASASTTSINLGDFSDPPMSAGVNRSRSNGHF